MLIIKSDKFIGCHHFIHANFIVVGYIIGGTKVIEVRSVATTTEPNVAGGYSWDIGRDHGGYHDNRLCFLAFHFLRRLLSAVTSEFLLDEIEVENDTVEDDLCGVGEDEPKIEETLVLILLHDVNDVFY